MKTAVLVTPICKEIPVIEGADYIGIDAGALKILDAGLELSMSMGDFDSMPALFLAKLKEQGSCYEYPVEKDETDTELVLDSCYEKYERLILAGALGGRLDHSLANLSLLIHRYAKKLVLMSEDQRAMVLEKGEHELEGDYKHISFFALEPSLISIYALKYEAEMRKLEPEDIYAVSNSFVKEKKGKVCVHEGRLLCVMSNRK